MVYVVQVWMRVVRGMRGVGEMSEMCMSLAEWVERGCVDERIRFGIYQSCENIENAGRVSVFGLRWCVWCRREMGRGIGQVSGGVGWCYVCVR